MTTSIYCLILCNKRHAVVFCMVEYGSDFTISGNLSWASNFVIFEMQQSYVKVKPSVDTPLSFLITSSPLYEAPFADLGYLECLAHHSY